jgi:hypothetical protein
VGGVADQDGSAEERVRLINFCDRCGVGVAALAQQVTDRSAELAEVATPVARGPTIPAGDVGIAEDCPLKDLGDVAVDGAHREYELGRGLAICQPREPAAGAPRAAAR